MIKISSKYERELRDVFLGDEDTIERLGKTMDDEALSIYYMLTERPWAVVRGAGSLGTDLVLLRRMDYLPIEVKSLKDTTFYFSDQKRLKEQKRAFKKQAEEKNIPFFFAFRPKGVSGEKWEIYRLHDKSDHKKYTYVPKLPTTRNGADKMEFGEGMWLSDFIYEIMP